MAVLDLSTFLPVEEDGRSETSDPMILSGSSVNTYLRCGRQWEYAYVMQLRRPPSIKQGLGIAAHEAVAINLQQKVLTYQDLPEEEVLQKFLDTWDQLSVEIDDVTNEVRLDERTGKTTKTRRETKAMARDSGANAVMVHYEDFASKVQPVQVEHEVSFTLNDTVAYTGILDMTDDRNAVRDHKFVSRKPQDGGGYILPMVGYALGFRHETGETESRIVLDHIVRTQTPYYLPLASDGPITDQAIQEFARIVTDVRRSIDAGVFQPNGLHSHACGWCGYADICPAYRAANGGRNV